MKTLTKHQREHGESQGARAWLLPSRGWIVRLPDGFTLTQCSLHRAGGDLIVRDPAAGRAVLRHFYEVESPPDLRDASGNLLAGDLARLVAGLPPDVMGDFLKRGFGARRSTG
jgi:hypothetical protein